MVSDQEMAVTIAKDLNCFAKFDQFIILCNQYRTNRSEIGIDCENCNFLMNLRYLYVENLIIGQNIEKLQKYCQFNYGKF